LECDQVGKRLEKNREDRFWTSAYEVFYNDQQIEACTKFWEACEVNLGLED
jgi:hypothetical protein